MRGALRQQHRHPRGWSTSGTSTAAGRSAVLGGDTTGVELAVALQLAAKRRRLDRVGGAAKAAPTMSSAGQPSE